MDPAILHAIWFDCPDLSDTEHKLSLALAYHCHHGTTCYPSVSRLGRMIRRTPRQTRTLLRQLEKMGYISVTVKRGRGHSNHYEINRKLLLPVFSEIGSLEFRSKPEVQTSPELLREEERKKEAQLLKLGLTPGSIVWQAALNGHQK